MVKRIFRSLPGPLPVRILLAIVIVLVIWWRLASSSNAPAICSIMAGSFNRRT